jgi:hypothetical protein
MVNLNSLNTAPLQSKPRRQRNGTWLVDSSTNTLVAYTVKQGEHGLECTCAGFYHRHACKHVDLVLAQEYTPLPEREPRQVVTLESLYDI